IRKADVFRVRPVLSPDSPRKGKVAFPAGKRAMSSARVKAGNRQRRGRKNRKNSDRESRKEEEAGSERGVPVPAVDATRTRVGRFLFPAERVVSRFATRA